MGYPKVLLTGVSGFVGQHLLRTLNYRGEFLLVAASRRTLESDGNAQIPLLIDGINGATSWQDCQELQDVEIVVHLAARAHVLNETSADAIGEFRRVNVDGTLNLARHASKSGVRRFVFVSSIGVNGSESWSCPFTEVDSPHPHNAYSLSKWEAEQGLLQIADATGMAVVIIRPPLVYGCNAPGNFGALQRAVKRRWPLPLGCVRNLRSLVAVDNLVDFIVTTMTHPQAANETFLVSDGQDLSTVDLVRGLAQAAQVPLRLLSCPMWALRVGASLFGKSSAVRLLSCNLQVDIAKARCMLGWVPPISINEGFKRAMGVPF